MKKLLFAQRKLIHRNMAKVVGVVVFCLFIFNSFFSSAQNPLVKMWDKRFGGDSMEWVNDFQHTADKGFIIGGSSLSDISGDKSQPNWTDYDYWIIKLDSLGNKQWDKSFGGTGEDVLSSLQQTHDGGYILGGHSASGISGDKSQPIWGGQDYWIIKIDSLGAKQWDRDIGGTGVDYLSSIQQTTDGGYILGGISQSTISGDKTQTTWGDDDYWIIKVDSLGNKLWDKDFGGFGYDELYSLEQTLDGGYILAGYSTSGISGDKSQSTWGSWDYWIVKLDSLGNKQWDKDFGGNDFDGLFSAMQTTDAGFILGGTSRSDISGDKSQLVRGGSDYWILKTDSLGVKQWDKTFGGTDNEAFWNVSQTTENGFLLSGESYSSLSGDKTEDNLGIRQTWLINTDSLGNKLWDKTVLSTGDDQLSFAIQTDEGCYAIVNNSFGTVGGYKTQPAWNNSYDYWIIKFCDSTLTTNIANTEKANEQLLLFPNPTAGKFTIQNSSSKIDRIEIYNLIGEKKYAAAVSSSSQQIIINIESFPAGIYFVKTIAGEKVLFGKVIKE